MGKDNIPPHIHTHTLTQMSSSMHSGGSDLVWQPNPDLCSLYLSLFRMHRVHQEQKHSAGQTQSRAEARLKLLELSVATKPNYSECLLLLLFLLLSAFLCQSQIKDLYTEAKVVDRLNTSRQNQSETLVWLNITVRII